MSDYRAFLEAMDPPDDGHSSDRKGGNGSDTSGDPLRQLVYVSGRDIPSMYGDFDDELIEGILHRQSLAVLFGASNSGKTFLAVDMACAVATGRTWFGRNVKPGIVLYLANEAPGSVVNRVTAHKMRYGPDLTRLIVVQSPINLFQSDADATAVLALVSTLETLHGDKVAMVIGDTLASLAPGANENAADDMSVVLRNAMNIQAAAHATFMLIHHAGKDTSKGMRGWSGLRAAVDTEIEVTQQPGTDVRTAEITKQRDIPGSGTRLGFRLESELIGKNAWGNPRTSCVVVKEDAPPPPTTGYARNAVAGAILEFMNARGQGAGCKRAVIAKHFDGRYVRTSIYRTVTKLVAEGALHQVGEVVSLVASG